MQGDVAREHRISNVQVSNLVCKATKNKNFLEELVHQKEAKEDKTEQIKSVVEELNHNDEFIDSVDFVCQKFYDKHG